MNEMLAFSCLSFFTVRNSFRFCMKFIILLSALVHIPSITWALQNAFLWPIPQSVKSGQVDVPLEVRSFYGLVIVCISQLTPTYGHLEHFHHQWAFCCRAGSSH